MEIQKSMMWRGASNWGTPQKTNVRPQDREQCQVDKQTRDQGTDHHGIRRSQLASHRQKPTLPDTPWHVERIQSKRRRQDSLEETSSFKICATRTKLEFTCLSFSGLCALQGRPSREPEEISSSQMHCCHQKDHGLS